MFWNEVINLVAGIGLSFGAFTILWVLRLSENPMDSLNFGSIPGVGRHTDGIVWIKIADLITTALLTVIVYWLLKKIGIRATISASKLHKMFQEDQIDGRDVLKLSFLVSATALGVPFLIFFLAFGQTETFYEFVSFSKTFYIFSFLIFYVTSSFTFMYFIIKKSNAK